MKPETERTKNLINYKAYYQSVLDKIASSKFLEQIQKTQKAACVNKRKTDEQDAKYISKTSKEAGVPLSLAAIEDAKKCEDSFTLK